jgi:hypothetical protein
LRSSYFLIVSFLCGVLNIFVCSRVPFLLAIVLSVLRFTLLITPLLPLCYLQTFLIKYQWRFVSQEMLNIIILLTIRKAPPITNILSMESIFSGTVIILKLNSTSYCGIHIIRSIGSGA